jgi:hypothetical protein
LHHRSLGCGATTCGLSARPHPTINRSTERISYKKRRYVYALRILSIIYF